jgi:reductive dehalogenase
MSLLAPRPLAPPPFPTERVDERDTMFARAARRPGTPAYDDYYGRLRPEWREVDDRIRALPGLCMPGGRFHEPGIARDAIAFFEAIESIEVDLDFAAPWIEHVRRTSDPRSVLLALARASGAVAGGVAAVDPAFVYTHKGRFDEDYGAALEPDHGTAIVFLVEMDHAAMMRAPRAPAIRESARQYYRAARIAKIVEHVIREAGHGARAHYDAHYELILPPLAVLAGLGELGRNNILVADRFGSRVRIGAVSTDLELRRDRPVSLGVARFCEICRKCADNCPSRALSRGEREVVRGVTRWATDAERCYAYWRRVGTDCGICMACCPFSHENNTLHNAVRTGLRLSSALARPALWIDDLVYGRDWRRRRFRGRAGLSP